MKHLKNLCILAWCGIVSVRLRPLGHELACLCELVDEVERRMEVLGVWTQGACALTALYFFWSGVRVRGLCDRWGRWLCGVFWGLGAVAGFIWFKGTRLVSGWELEAVVVLAVTVTGVWGLGCAAFAPDRWRRLGRWVFGLGILLSAVFVLSHVALLLGFCGVAEWVPVPLTFVMLAGGGASFASALGGWPQGRVCRRLRWGCVAGGVLFVSAVEYGGWGRIVEGRPPVVVSFDSSLACCLVILCSVLVLGLSLWRLGIQFLVGLIPAKWREKTVTFVVRTLRGLVSRGRRWSLREWFPGRRTP